MRVIPRRRTALAVLTTACAALAAAQAVTATTAAAQGDTTPWAGSDNAAVGGLTFYDAAGHVVTSGATNNGSFAAYVAARVDTKAGDTLASLQMYTPEASNPGAWTKSTTLGPSSTYPNANAPGALGTATLPVYTAGASDTTLDEHVASYPQTSTTTGYVNVYEVRLYTRKPRQTMTLSYGYADVRIDSAAHTWSLVYTPGDSPVQATAPAAPAAPSATAHDASADVSYPAPADNGSPITGYDIQYSSDSGANWTSASAAFHTSTLTVHTVTGLTNGTAYVFRVAAINGIGQGQYSTASTAVTPAAPVATPSTLTNSVPTSATYNSTSKVSATLTAQGGPAIANAPVKLFRKVAPAKTFSFVGTATTGATGIALVTVRNVANTQYYWRYDGTATHQGVQCAAKAMTVVPRVYVYRSASTIKSGRAVSIYGYVSPVSTGTGVLLQRLVNRKWVSLANRAVIKTQRMPNGKTMTGYLMTFKLRTRGGYTFRVGKPAVATLGAAYSGSVAVKVA